jgi:hypothetical protein
MRSADKRSSAIRRRSVVPTVVAKTPQPSQSIKVSQVVRCGLTIVVGALGLLFGGTADATYNANLSGTVVSFATYDNGEILVILSNQPTSNGSCSATFFELDPPEVGGSTVVNDAAFDRMTARLALAYAAGQPVTLGYDNASNCAAGGYIRVYRVG